MLQIKLQKQMRFDNIFGEIGMWDSDLLISPLSRKFLKILEKEEKILGRIDKATFTLWLLLSTFFFFKPPAPQEGCTKSVVSLGRG